MNNTKQSTGNLVLTWIYVEEKIYNRDLHAAINVLNRSLNAAYTPSRILQWSRVKKEGTGRGSQLPRTLRLYMGNIVIFHVLQMAGIRPTTIEKLDLSTVVQMLH